MLGECCLENEAILKGWRKFRRKQAPFVKTSLFILKKWPACVSKFSLLPRLYLGGHGMQRTVLDGESLPTEIAPSDDYEAVPSQFTTTHEEANIKKSKADHLSEIRLRK